MKRTKIVCTLGPASDQKSMIKKMIKNGMNVARLNLSHNVHAYHKKVIQNVRSVSKELKIPVGIILDLQGPRIRLGDLPEEGIKLSKGEKVVLTTADGLKNKIPVTYKNMHKDVKAGQRILIADGLIELLVEKVIKQDLHCKVVSGGMISSHKGINLPDTEVSLPALSEKDKKDLAFGMKNQVDFVALSFVRNAREVKSLKRLITKHVRELKRKTMPKVIVKIERNEALENFDEILKATDAVMVARGDLGIELPAEQVPIKQKQIIEKCLHEAKPVIVATQMLDSMIQNPRPTRAEVSDVANAVIDHADAVMLSGETANGKYPLQSVKMMNNIIEQAEESVYDDLVLQTQIKKYDSSLQAAGAATKLLSEKTNAGLILGATISGYTARVISRYRPELPIVVSCTEDMVVRQLALTWGVRAFKLGMADNLEKLIKKGIDYLKKNKLVKKNDEIIIIAGVSAKNKKRTSIVELVNI